MNISGRDVLEALRSYLDRREPKIARWLVNTWNAEREAIKYEELEYATTNKEVPLEWLLQWQQDYAEFIKNVLDPEWRAAVKSAGSKIEEKIREGVQAGEMFSFTPTGQRIEQWIQTRGGELIAQLSQTQLDAVRAILRHYTVEVPVSPQELGRILRPVIGLTEKQAKAVQRFRESLLAEGMNPRQAERQALKYAGQLHRFRALRIARTELAFAYNQGQYEAIRQAQEAGILRGRVVKEWMTAEDERVCPHCGPLDGQIIGFEETFPGATKILPQIQTPPAHPLCRCTVGYRIIEE